MEKYTWFRNHNQDLSFSVKFDDNGLEETLIAITDTAEKADFIAKACNQFSIEKYEELEGKTQSNTEPPL